LVRQPTDRSGFDIPKIKTDQHPELVDAPTNVHGQSTSWRELFTLSGRWLAARCLRVARAVGVLAIDLAAQSSRAKAAAAASKIAPVVAMRA
jgi:hypothetical protein